MKKTGALLLGLALSLFALFPLSAREAAYTGEDYNIRLFYNDVAFPGDAVFVRMIIEQNGKKNKDKQLEETSATLELFNSEKTTKNAESNQINADMYIRIPIYDGVMALENDSFNDVGMVGYYGEDNLEIAKKLSAKGMLIGIDRDKVALVVARERLKDYQNKIIHI